MPLRTPFNSHTAYPFLYHLSNPASSIPSSRPILPPASLLTRESFVPPLFHQLFPFSCLPSSFPSPHHATALVHYINTRLLSLFSPQQNIHISLHLSSLLLSFRYSIPMATSKHCSFLCFLFMSSQLLFGSCLASRKLTEVEEKQPLTITYHKGALLSGPISINLLWYGKFTTSQRTILSDFVSSLSAGGEVKPSVYSWWKMAEKYYVESKLSPPQLTLGKQILDENYSLGKSLKNSDIAALAVRGPARRALSVVLTADDVVVEGFCMSRCGSHGSSPLSKASRLAYIWVGNSAVQCPGQCAWPFHQPVYGPQAPPLVAPNGDIGDDGMVMNLASMIAGAVTNPFGGGFFMGPKTAPLEAATACPGVYGRGAYPGYAGELMVDPATSASYNANGVRGRKYLLPAIFDASTAYCSTLV